MYSVVVDLKSAVKQSKIIFLIFNMFILEDIVPDPDLDVSRRLEQ